MKSKRNVTWMVILVLLTSACQGAPTPSAAPPRADGAALTPSPSSSPRPAASQRRSVVLIALDGIRSDWISAHMQDGTMPNLSALAKRGVAASYLQSVEPGVAATTYLSMSTGALPSRIGLVSDRYHVPQKAFHEAVGPASDGAVESLEQLVNAPEPIWRTAMRNGLKTAALFWPSAPLDVADLNADYTVAIAESDAQPAQHVVTFQDAKGWGTTPRSFSPLREGVLRVSSKEGSTVASFNALAVDSTEDDTVNYDLLILDTDKDVSNDDVELHLSKLSPVTISPRLQSGAYLCLTASSCVSATIYQSQVCYSRAHPSELLRAINARLGFPSPGADVAALRKGWISPQQCYEMADMRSKWMMNVTAQVYQTYQPDLLLTMQDVVAQCARAFLLVEKAQEGYSEEKAELYRSYLQKAHAAADQSLSHILGLVNLADAVVFVISGQGTVPVHTTVRVNTILKNAGLLQLKSSAGFDDVDETRSKALAFASGGSAHIYINLQGREWPGIVPPSDYETVQKKITQALDEVQDEGGQPVFARVLKGEALGSIHLESPNSGDVFVQAAPGYCLSDELGSKKVFAPSSRYAETGFDTALPEMRGFFVACGDGVSSGRVIPPVAVTDIAPTIAKALHMEPSATMVGRVLDEIWP